MMNKKVFISGSISIKNLDKNIFIRLENIIEKNIQVLVGDASGIDILIQEFFARKNYYNVTVYSIYPNPRNIYSKKFSTKIISTPNNIKKERERQVYKDKQMTVDSNYSFIIWDNKSKGSYGNAIRALKLNKKIVVYLNNEQNFLKQEKCTVPEIEFIYRKHNGYSASEIVEYLKQERIEFFSNTKDLNKFLVKNKIIVKGGKDYEPSPELSSDKVASYFIRTQYKGRDTGINYTNDLIEWIQKEIKKTDTKESDSEQGLLF